LLIPLIPKALALPSLKTTNEALERTAEDLKSSNEDLEHYAYMASHDLREPLRKVSGFLSLLEHRTKGKLDPEAVEYVRYAVDGAKRMQFLIDDLLAYSRVSGSKEPLRK